MSIYTKLLEIQKLHLEFSKDAQNPFFKSKYVSLDSIVSKLTPILDEKQLLVIHYTEKNEIVTKVINTEEEDIEIESRFPLIQSTDPQKLGSCITYAKRYNLGQIFNIITDRDDDANEASGVEEEIKVGTKKVEAKKVDTPSGGTKEKAMASEDEHCPNCGEHCQTRKGFTKEGRGYEMGNCSECNTKFFVNRK